MNPSAYIWRDAHDREQFYIGIKMRDGKFAVLCDITADSIFDLFGKDARDVIRDTVGTTPTRCFLDMKVPETTPAR